MQPVFFRCQFRSVVIIIRSLSLTHLLGCSEQASAEQDKRARAEAEVFLFFVVIGVCRLYFSVVDFFM